MSTRSTTAQQQDSKRRYVIRLVQVLAKDKKGVPAREPWTPAGVWTQWTGNDSSPTFSVDHATWKAFGLDSAGMESRSNNFIYLR